MNYPASSEGVKYQYATSNGLQPSDFIPTMAVVTSWTSC